MGYWSEEDPFKISTWRNWANAGIIQPLSVEVAIMRKLVWMLAVTLAIFAAQNVAAADSLGTWKDRNTPDTYDWYGLAYGNGAFVGVGEYWGAGATSATNFAATSSDGKTWNEVTIESASLSFNQVIYSKGRFILVCKMPETGTGARIHISDNNGTTWKAVNADPLGYTLIGGLHAVSSDGGSNLMAVGGTSTGRGWITRSSDNGGSWNIVKSDANVSLYGVGYACGAWFAMGSSVVYKSTNGGSSWSELSGGPTVSGRGYKLATDGSIIVVAGSSGPKWSADKGVTWNSGKAASGFESAASLGSMGSVVYADGIFSMSAAVSRDVWTSETGVTWKPWKLVGPSGVYYTENHALCYAKRSFWSGGLYGLMAESPTWFKARVGAEGDYPFTLFDAEDAPPNRVGLPMYRVNTASLNLILESTLFYAPTWSSPVRLQLAYCSAPCPDGDSSIGPFGKNWCFRYNSHIGRFGQEAQLVTGGGRSYWFLTPKGEELDSVTGRVDLLAPTGVFDALVYKPAGVDGAVCDQFELTLKKNRLTYVYAVATSQNSIFHLTAIRDLLGNEIKFDVDAENGQIKTIKDAAGRTFTLFYNNEGLCSEIGMPDGRSVEFSYDSDKNLTEISDMMGYKGRYQYDGNGFLTKMTTAGRVTSFSYVDRPGYEDSEENPGAKCVNSVTLPSGEKIGYEVLEEGERVRRTSPEGEKTTLANEKGQTSQVADPLGATRTTAYNNLNLPASVTDADGGVFSYEYDDRGNLTQKTDALGNSSSFDYDENDNLTKITNALGKSWVYAYDSKRRPLSITTPLNNKAKLTYFNAASGSAFNGKLKSMEDALGNVTSFTYDGFGNPASIASTSGGTSSFTYDAGGFHCAGMLDPNGNEKSLDWDNNDRLTKVTYDSVMGSPSYSNVYDAFGQTSFTDELGKTTTFERNVFGFIKCETTPVDAVTRYEYDKNQRLVKTTDPLDRVSTIAYDEAGRPTLMTDPGGFKITKAYDGDGNLTSFKNQNEATTSFIYDANNRLICTTDPANGKVALTRDELGRVEKITNARGQTITNTFDADGRFTKKEVDGSTDVTMTYDANGNVTNRTDAWGATTFVYDDSNRVTSVTYPDGKSVSMTRLLGGQISEMTYPGGFKVSYAYDKFNRAAIPSVLNINPKDIVRQQRDANAVTGMTVSGLADVTMSFSYDQSGKLIGSTRSNGTESEYAYDNAGRLTQISHAASGGDPLFTATFTLDKAGNATQQSFSGRAYYSSLKLPVVLAMTYDKAGRLKTQGSTTCSSDADGNLLTWPSNTASYDAENQLTRLVQNDGQSSKTFNYAYCIDGFRVKVTRNGSTTFYHYLPTGKLLFTTDGDGAVIDRHVYADGRLLATFKSSGQWWHYYGDHQASVRFVADQTGTVLTKYDYLPYGQKDVSVSINETFTFNGLLNVQDDGDGLYYMHHRVYNANSGRFLQGDPLGLEAGPNLYAFADGDPIGKIDPDGEFAFIAALVFITTAATVVGVAMVAAESHFKAERGRMKQEVKDMRAASAKARLERRADKNNLHGIERMVETGSYKDDSYQIFLDRANRIKIEAGFATEVGGAIGKEVLKSTVLKPLGDVGVAVDIAHTIYDAQSTEDSE